MTPKLDYARLLEGKVAVITSGGHGMGKYVAKIFAKHGALCAINGMNPSGEETAEELRKDSPGSFFLRCDMSLREDVERFVHEVIERTGGADVVINNVGINKSQASPLVSDEDFEYTQQVNLYGTIRMSRGFLPKMIERGGGAFVHISTVHSRFAIPGNTAYASSKSAINGFSVALAADFARYGVRSNVICPGGIYTRSSDEMFARIASDDQALLDIARRGGPAQPDYGAGSAHDIGHAALFLASDMARRITGEVVMVDGATVLQAHPFLRINVPEDSDELWLGVMRTRF